METLIKKSQKNIGKRVFKATVLLFSILILSVVNATGQNNVKPSTTDAANAEVIKAQKEADHQEFMNYLYMALGFGLIVGVAWFTVAGKNKKTEKPVANSPQYKKHFHSSDSKKYGTSRARG